jgi:transcriptional regulator with XRE-family HTH domain
VVKRVFTKTSISFGMPLGISILIFMQAQILLHGAGFEEDLYNAAMSSVPFGSRLAEARKAAGLTQSDLAAKLGVAQSNISFWESWEKPPRGEVLPNIAEAVGVSVDELLGVKPIKPKAEPTGKVKQAFTAVSKLPRRQQEQILKVINALLVQQQTQTRKAS